MEKRNSIADLVGLPSQVHAGLSGTMHERVSAVGTKLTQPVLIPFAKEPAWSDDEWGMVQRFTDANGQVDLDGMRRYCDALEKKLRPKMREVERSEAMKKTLERFLKILQAYDLQQHDQPLPMLHLRKRLLPEYFVHMLHREKEEPPPIARFKHAHWFDFRRLPTNRAHEMIEFGKELVEQGLVRLPFETCVFVFPYATPDGSKITSACLLRQDRDKMVAEGVMHLEAQGRPLGLYGKDEPANDPIFFAMSVLSSRSVVQRRKSVTSETEVESGYKGDSYFEVAVRQRPHAPGISHGHASPRLHWRRGHIRHLGNRTTWVRASLVGKSENGVVVHDYRA